MLCPATLTRSSRAMAGTGERSRPVVLLAAGLLMLVLAAPQPAAAYRLAMYVYTAPGPDADGTERPADCQLLMIEPARDRFTLGSPSWSPDGTQVVFDASYHGRDPFLFVVNVQTDATNNLGRGCVPSWRPDGQTITFARVDEKWDLRGLFDVATTTDVPEAIVDAEPRRNGSDEGPRDLTFVAPGSHPQWTADGQFLLFHQKHTNNPETLGLRDAGQQSYLVLMPEGRTLKSRPRMAGNNSFTAIASNVADGYDARIERFFFTKDDGAEWDESASPPTIRVKAEPLVNWGQLDSRIGETTPGGGLKWFTETSMAGETGELFFRVEVKRPREGDEFPQATPDDEDLVVVDEIWRRSPEGELSPVLRGWPGVQLRDFAITADGRRLVFCSDLIEEEEQDGEIRFAEDLIVGK